MRDLRLMLSLVTKTEILIIGSLSALYAVAEGFSMSLLLPIFQSIQEGTSILEGSDLAPHLRMVRWLIDLFHLPANLGSLLMLAFVGILIRQLFQFLRVTQGAKVQERVSAHIRGRGFAAFVHSDIRFLNGQQRGRLHSVLVSEAPRGGSVALQFLLLLGAIFLFIGYIILLSLLSPVLTLIAVGVSILALTTVRFVSKASWEHGQQISSLNGDLNSALTEKLSGIREVKMVNLEEQEARSVRGITDRLAAHMVKLRMLAAGLDLTVEPLMVVGAFVILFLAAEVFDMPLASLVMFMFVLLRMVPLTKLVNASRQQIRGYMASCRNALDTISEAEASRQIVGGTRKFQQLQSEIRFDQVSFTYGQNGPAQSGGNGTAGWALQDVSIVIPRGSRTALVGKSGAGKSTLVNLIPRLYDVSRGQIRLDGIPIQEFSLESLRRSIGFVSQEVFLFNDSVYNNLTYGLPSVNREAVEDATRRAYAYEFIQGLPGKFDSLLGDRGVRLSAGQRQRLSIAKAILQDPEILILDEPTSALDSESELYVQRALEDLHYKRTVIVIAHRLSTIRKADKILVLDEGRIVEEGDHGLLLENNGTYKRLFDLQMIGG